jgi:hypothetical protein
MSLVWQNHYTRSWHQFLIPLCCLKGIEHNIFFAFVSFEGRRFGVPYSYTSKTVRVLRNDDSLYIYSADLRNLLATHNVTWSRQDSFCIDQFALPEQPEEFPTMPVKTVIKQLPEPSPDLSFEKFNFSKDGDWNE